MALRCAQDQRPHHCGCQPGAACLYAWELTLQSADPLVQPDINLNFFADDLDVIAMRECLCFTSGVLIKGECFKDLAVSEYPWEMPLQSDVEMKHPV